MCATARSCPPLIRYGCVHNRGMDAQLVPSSIDPPCPPAFFGLASRFRQFVSEQLRFRQGEGVFANEQTIFLSESQ